MNVQITPQINADVIMPEGFEVQLTLTSLVPETKNLMYDSIDNPVISKMAEPDNETKEKRVGKYSYKHEDPTATVNPRMRKVPTRKGPKP